MMDLRGSIFFLCFVMISSAADPLKTLTASVGGNITLPDAVEEEGFLLYEGKTLALVHDKKLLNIYGEKYKKRLHWNQNTGYFTLTRLQKNDSGKFTVDSEKGRIVNVHYNLIVYDSVPTPEVSVLNRSSESCSLNCSVDSAQEDVTLLWSKDLKILKNLSAASLSLTVFSQQDLNSPFQCVAENPAENKTVSVDVRMFCQLNRRENTSSSTVSRHHLIVIVIPIVCGVVLFLSVYLIWRFCHQKKSTVGQTEDVVYTDVICQSRSSKDVISQEPSNSEHCNLDTVYDQPVFRHADC